MKKILLDENLPNRLTKLFPKESFELYTIHSLNWDGKSDGDMLRSMEKENFNYLITADKNLKFQQNLQNFNFRIIIIRSKNNRYKTIESKFKKVLNTLIIKNLKIKRLLRSIYDK